MSQPVAVVDLGTHTVKLLVAARDGDAGLAVLHDETRFARLGEGVDATGQLASAAISRARDAVADYVAISRRLGAERVEVVATSASRDAANGDELVLALESVGAQVRIISGAEEARLTLAGALSGTLEPVITLIDIGGGSTEVATAARRGGGLDVRALASLDVGSVRLKERLWSSLPPSPSEVAELRTAVRAALRLADVAPAQAPVWGVAGTVACLAALAAGHSDLDAARLHGLALTADAAGCWANRLASLDEPATLALRPALLSGRAHLIGAGAAILDELLTWVGASWIRVSTSDLRHGRAAELLSA